MSPRCCIYKDPQGLLSQATTPHTEENAASDDRDGDPAAVSDKGVPRAAKPFYQPALATWTDHCVVKVSQPPRESRAVSPEAGSIPDNKR